MGEQEGGLNRPIPIIRGEGSDELALRKQKESERKGWAVFILFAVVVLGLLSPLVVWLIRIALGG